ncbi:MAG: hypothetical protein RL375_1703 [Pseudomonadota bacterium]
MQHFDRSALAQDIVTALQGRTVFSDAPNGLFLAAPRRTGKSTFLQADLQPALEAQGVVVVYVDLWADQARDPGLLIADAIGRALTAHLGVVAKAARATGLDSISIAGLKIDTSRIGRIDGATLVDALRALHDTAQAPVALIVDEAQQALVSEAGEAAMAALKSARDQLNRPGQVNLMLVMSGSDQDKLTRLVTTNGAPFYGSQVQRMPPLGPEFIAHLLALIEAQRPELKPVDSALLQRAFEAFGHRPQFFMDALGRALSPFTDLSAHAGRFELAVLQAAAERQRDDEDQLASDFLALRPVEQALLWRLLEQGERFRPYDAAALRFYRDKTGLPVTPAQAQKALEALRQRNPAVVWKSARGDYAVHDVAMHRWYQQQSAAGRWPPPSNDPTGLALGDNAPGEG